MFDLAAINRPKSADLQSVQDGNFTSFLSHRMIFLIKSIKFDEINLGMISGVSHPYHKHNQNIKLDFSHENGFDRGFRLDVFWETFSKMYF